MGKSFVSFYTPRPKGDVRTLFGQFRVSQQLITELEVAAQRELDGLVHDLVAGWDESRRNGHIGPMHRPGRNELRELQRADRRRRRLREYVRSLGRPAGEFRRVT